MGEQQQGEVVNGVVKLINLYFGESTAVVYRQVYANMPVELVLKSSQELLEQYVGTFKAQELLASLHGETITMEEQGQKREIA